MGISLDLSYTEVEKNGKMKNVIKIMSVMVLFFSLTSCMVRENYVGRVPVGHRMYGPRYVDRVYIYNGHGGYHNGYHRGFRHHRW